MTGLPDLNFPAFHAAAARLRQAGYDVCNPADLLPADTSWETCMRADIKALCDCDGLVLLPGWECSRGAHLELHVAHRLGLSVATLQAQLCGVLSYARDPEPAAPALADDEAGCPACVTCGAPMSG